MARSQGYAQAAQTTTNRLARLKEGTLKIGDVIVLAVVMCHCARLESIPCTSSGNGPS